MQSMWDAMGGLAYGGTEGQMMLLAPFPYLLATLAHAGEYRPMVVMTCTHYRVGGSACI
jgi:hypothetical protein